MKNIVVRKAFVLALSAHEHQLYGSAPYVVHLYDVVRVLERFGHAEPVLVAAAWLHDVIEDTPRNYHEVKDITNEAVAEIVLALTDEIGRNRKERKAKTLPKLKGKLDVQTVKLADWIANVEDAVRQASPMLQMYKKDYPSLRMACRSEFEELRPMWDCLDAMLGVED